MKIAIIAGLFSAVYSVKRGIHGLSMLQAQSEDWRTSIKAMMPKVKKKLNKSVFSTVPAPFDIYPA